MIVVLILVALFLLARFIEKKAVNKEKVFNRRLNVNVLVISWIAQLVFLSSAIISLIIYLI